MIGRRSTIGLALLCAFAFCAFAAQSAMAQVGTKSTNTTAVTCVLGGGDEDFADAHCDEFVGIEKGDYGHEPISKDTTTEIEVTSEKTKDTPEKPTFDDTPAKLNGTLAGAATEVICTKVKSGAGKSFIHNVETEGKHTVTGTVDVEFSDCKVEKPAKCAIKEPITTTATFRGVEGLKPGGNDMGLEFVGTGENKDFAELTYANKGEEKCALNGITFVVKGSVIATGKVAQGNDHSGATSVYEDANEMETLEIGGKKASFAGTFTTTMAGAGGNPIALTTTT